MLTIYLLAYNVFLRLYSLGIWIASFFSLKAKSLRIGRQRLYSRLRINIVSIHGRKVWVHCASLGEFEQARPLIEMIREREPDTRIILTFSSPSGYDVRRYYDQADFVSYLPLDTSCDAKKFIGIVKPDLVIWVKYEYWYHMLHELRKRNIPVVHIAAIFRPDHVFFRWYGELHRRMLTFFTHIFVQNEESHQLLQGIGIASEVSPDPRFDRVVAISRQRKEYESIAAFKGDKKMIVCGSTWTKDADLICRLINEDPFDGRFRYLIAPHEVSEDTIYYLINNINKVRGVMSRVNTQNAHEFDVVIVDGIGALASLYYYADMVYVGGGFGTSVHNILEPAVYGTPVIFGPNHQKSVEALAMLSHPEWQAAHAVSTYEQLLGVLKSLLINEEAYLKTGSVKAKEFVLSNTGGTEHIYGYLNSEKLL